MRRWVDPAADLPARVAAHAANASRSVFVDESDPAYSLEAADIATGRSCSLGYFSELVLRSGDSGLYAADGRYLVVNLNGDSSDQVPVAAIKSPAQG